MDFNLLPTEWFFASQHVNAHANNDCHHHFNLLVQFPEPSVNQISYCHKMHVLIIWLAPYKSIVIPFNYNFIKQSLASCAAFSCLPTHHWGSAPAWALCLTASGQQVITVLLTKHLGVLEGIIPYGHCYLGLVLAGLQATATGKTLHIPTRKQILRHQVAGDEHTLWREPVPGREQRYFSSTFMLSARLSLLSPWGLPSSQALNTKLHPCSVHFCLGSRQGGILLA